MQQVALVTIPTGLMIFFLLLAFIIGVLVTTASFIYAAHRQSKKEMEREKALWPVKSQ